MSVLVAGCWLLVAGCFCERVESTVCHKRTHKHTQNIVLGTLTAPLGSLNYDTVKTAQKNNRVWRTYGGGALIDNWKKTNPAVDGDMPEQWINRENSLVYWGPEITIYLQNKASLRKTFEPNWVQNY